MQLDILRILEKDINRLTELNVRKLGEFKKITEKFKPAFGELKLLL